MNDRFGVLCLCSEHIGVKTSTCRRLALRLGRQIGTDGQTSDGSLWRRPCFGWISRFHSSSNSGLLSLTWRPPTTRGVWLVASNTWLDLVWKHSVRWSCLWDLDRIKAQLLEWLEIKWSCTANNWWYLQLRCFFLGPSNSLVVALRTTNERPWPEMKYLTAWSLSSSDCPPPKDNILSKSMYWWRFASRCNLGLSSEANDFGGLLCFGACLGFVYIILASFSCNISRCTQNRLTSLCAAKHPSQPKYHSFSGPKPLDSWWTSHRTNYLWANIILYLCI